MHIKKIVLGFLLMSSSLFAQTLKTERSELVFPLQPEHAHSSSIVGLPNGDMLLTWFQGSGERLSDDVRIMGARLKKGSSKWGVPFVMADTPFIPDCNPVLFLNHDKKLFLVWIVVQANQWEHSVLKVLTTKDYLKDDAPNWTWQENIFLKPGEEFVEETAKRFKELPSNTNGWAEFAPSYDKMIIEASKDAGKRSFGWMTRIKPLLLPKNKIVLPLYSDGYNFSLMAISEDDGKTWKPGLPLVGRGPIQPALARKKDGTLVALMRDSGDAPARVHYSESSDEGYSWKPTVKTDIPNTASVELLTLKNGLWLFLGNDINGGRSQVSLYVSDDEGKTWKWKHKLESQDKGGYSYPSLIQTEDGAVHLTYSYHKESKQKSIKYIKINPESLTK